MKRMAIFASGNGTNAEKILEKCPEKVSAIYSGKSDAGVVNVAKAYRVPVEILDKNSFYNTADILNKLKKMEVDFIVLAGFLWKMPGYMIKSFPQKIINLHPALLPKFGGQGMYGMHVHRAVINAGEGESGITIHYVNENYDEGEIIFQAKCPVLPVDSPETLAKKIQLLEHTHYPQVVCRFVS